MIINSLLDTDLYKFTMMQVVFHHFSQAQVEYHFRLRKPDIDFRPYAETIQHEINHLAQLSFQEDELTYLQTLPYIKEDFIALLRNFKLNSDYVEIKTEPHFEIIIRGPWLQTILFEIPILAIISEIYSRTHRNPDYSEGKKRLADKISFVKAQSHLVAQTNTSPFKFTDFGTRRRFSYKWQNYVVEQLHKQLPQNFCGTSNVYFAKTMGLTPTGTMAHEYVQAFQALGPNVRDSQKAAFETWFQEYRGLLGIALSDTFGLNTFLADFDLYFAKIYEGARQDSGDPFVWADAVIKHYQQLGIDPKTKTLVFSDALTMEKASAIYQRYSEQARLLFGIGTHLTNDLGYPTLDMVIKMVRCNGLPVAKISDAPFKAISIDESYLNYLKHILKYD